MAFGSGGNGGFSVPKKPKDKPKDNGLVPDIVKRYFDQVEETAKGLPSAIGYIGKTAWGDAKHLFGAGEQFRLDDLANDLVKTSWDDIKFRWSPLLKGDIKTWWDHVEEDPFGTTMDLATILTGGGAAIGKVGKAVAKSGNSSVLTHLAGLNKTTRSIYDDLPSLDKAIASDVSRRASFNARSAEALGGVVDNNGGVWEGSVGILRSGSKSLPIKLSANPVIRMRQQAGVMAANKFGGMPIFGSHRRVANLERKRIKRQAIREHELLTGAAEQAVGRLTPEQSLVMEVANFRDQGLSLPQINEFYAKQLKKNDMKFRSVVKRAGLDSVIDVNATKRGWKQIDTTDVRFVEMPDDNETNLIKQVIDSPEGKNLSPRDARVLVSRVAIHDRLKQVNELWDAAGEADNIPEVKAARDSLRDMSRKQSEIIWEAMDKKLRGQDISFEDFYQLQSRREAFHIVDPSVDMLDAYDNDVVDVSSLMQYLKDNNIDTSKSPIFRSHMAPSEINKLGGRVVNHKGDVTAPTSSRLKKNSFTTFDEALDMLSPDAMFNSARQVVEYKTAKEKFSVIMSTAIQVEHGMDAPKGYTKIDHNNVGKYLADTTSFLKEDARVIWGDSPELEYVNSVLDGVQKMVDTDSTFAPKAMVDELVKELKYELDFANRFVKATNIWKQLALTYRPVWITSNLVGQMTLLLTSQGLTKSALSWFQAIRMGKKSFVDLSAPEIMSAGFMNEARGELTTLARKHGKKSNAEVLAQYMNKNVMQRGAGKVADGMGELSNRILQFNAFLTDDVPRRAMFYGLTRKHIKKLQADTGMSFEDAGKAWLDSNPELVDELADKVMGDMIDFGDMTYKERKYIRPLLPFYSWLKGISSRTMRMAMDEPWKVWAANEAENWGSGIQEEELGSVPDYLKGAITLGENKDGIQRIIPTNSLNPFSTVGDIAGMAKSTLLGDIQVGGSNPASVINPLIKSGMESVANRDLFYGTPIDREDNQSYVDRFAGQIANSVPQLRTLGKIMQKDDPGSGQMAALFNALGLQNQAEMFTDKGTTDQALYENSPLDALLSYLLVPTKQLHTDRANAMAQAQLEGKIAPLV